MATYGSGGGGASSNVYQCHFCGEYHKVGYLCDVLKDFLRELFDKKGKKDKGCSPDCELCNPVEDLI